MWEKFDRSEAGGVPALDGVRGLAIFLVVCQHYAFLPFLGGVDLFFVLSGFLLGGIIIEKRGTPNFFKAFYVRRACRILPLYLVSVFVFFTVLALRGWLSPPVWFTKWQFADPLPLWSYLTFTQNFVAAYSAGWGAAWMAPAWSLAVEEQFYLVLPLLVALTLPRKLPYVLLAVILAAPVLRAGLHFALEEPTIPISVLLPTKADSLFLGVLAAWSLQLPRVRKVLSAPGGRLGLYGGFAVFAGLAAWALLHPPWWPRTSVPAPVLAGLLDASLAWFYCCLLVVAATEKRGPVSWLLRLGPMRTMGAAAYGAYLFHLPVLGLSLWLFLGGGRLGGPWARETVALVAMAATFALGWLSWRLFESRFVRWGHAFRYGEPKEVRPPR